MKYINRINRYLAVLAAFALTACSRPVKDNVTTEPFVPVEETVEQNTTVTSMDVESGSPNQWIAFRKDLTLDEVPASAPARIAVDSKYWLWVNGELAVFEGQLKRGPNPHGSYFDVVELAPYLKKGENKIALLLWYFGKDGFSHLGSGKAQMWFDCPAIGAVSDASWLCRILPAYGKADCPEPNYRLSETSISFDAREDIGDWHTGEPEGFAPAVVTESTLGTLQRRPIPFWKDYGIKEASFETRPGEECDTVVARLPYNMQMTPIIAVESDKGGRRILIETDHAKVGEQCLRAEYITKAGTQEYESLGWLNGMKIILTVQHGAKVTGIKYRETGYDTTPDGVFTCDDPFYNKFWEKGLRTIYVNARDNFFDCPERERGQWWGDIVTILGESFYTYSPSLHALIRKGIRELCDWQRPDNILFSPIPGNYGVELPCQMLAAVGRYGFWTYYMNTGDKATIEYVYPAVRRYLDTYHVGKDGLLEWHDGDWNWGDWGDNRDMRLLQSMWYCLALQAVSDMADVLGNPNEGGTLWERMNQLKDAINRVAWTGTCYRHPDYEGETDDRVQALAVVAGIAGQDKYEAIFETLKKEEHASPYMEKYIMEALFCIGHGDYALERERRRYDFMVNHPDFDTLFENWNVGVNGDWDCGSVNHAWSGGPLAVFPTKMFGVYPTEAGWKRFSVSPDEHIFNDCSISFPTVKGKVSVSFKRDGERILLDVEVPEGSSAEVNVPWARFHKDLGPGIHSMDLANGPVVEKGNFKYRDKNQPVEKRVKDLLGRMTLEEKVNQVSAQLLSLPSWSSRDYAKGHIRNIGHFLPDQNLPNDPKSVAEKINEDTRISIEASRWGIPVLQHGEALHGAQWGNATCFPQSIAMAATFDDDLYYQVGKVVAEELRAVGVRQVYAPVINVTRDQRWGRAQESYGEDVLMNSLMGVAYVKALEEGGVVATPKHYVDNYGEGGHDSFASPTSWRVLREVYLEPFRACVQEGGARGIMSSYNSVDGIPSSCNSTLLKDILKDEWGFKGIVVSDYDAVDIVHRSHGMAESEGDALALCMENGLDLQLHITSKDLLDLVKAGKISEKTIDESARRVLRIKFGLGLFDEPFVDPDKAAAIVRNKEHRQLAYEAASKSMTLLKNDGILPIRPGSVRRIGLFGPAANVLSLGDYSGARGGWKGDGVTPLQGLKDAYEGSADVVLNKNGQDVNSLARTCDVLVFFPAITEEEGRDRSSFKLPSANVIRERTQTNAVIIADQQESIVRIDQEKMIRDLIDTGKPVVVVLQNGAVIDVTEWLDGTAAVIDAWYPGEQGGRAIADVISGKVNPGGRLPFSWARTIGQNPMYYSIKPSGRGYGYVENDGKPLWPFGYGLSYTAFEYSDFTVAESLGKDQPLKVSVKVTNTGDVEGDEVVQVYIHDELASVARPMKELAAFRRVTLKPGESKMVELEIPYRRFSMWDKDMVQRVEEGWFEVWVGRNAEEKTAEGRVYVSGGNISS
ncbi:MAG: glycoside hydrolase family 3 C-terminal domain-containing protein [Bacteroidales bacterium]|nr:glycoside hydrolase family 3 C-terminal domain-containing protein [Bacteroidales bacterium]